MIGQPALALSLEPLPLRKDQSGVVRIGKSRVPLDTVIHFFQAGDSPEEIVEGFPTLDLADVYVTIGYYLRHRQEVDLYLKERERQAEEIRAEVEARQGDSRGLRERLLARRARLASTESK
jgi:uncharacterized protein (DUF433 family)